MIRRRLTGSERTELKSGEIFVWEEATYKGALTRWTDGLKWQVEPSPSLGYHFQGADLSSTPHRSASRMREPFLFYEEKYIRNPELKGPRRSVRHPLCDR